MTPQELRAWRKRHELTQGKAASRLGVSMRSVWRWEAGERIPQAIALSCQAIDQEAIMDQLESALRDRHKET